MGGSVCTEQGVSRTWQSFIVGFIFLLVSEEVDKIQFSTLITASTPSTHEGAVYAMIGLGVRALGSLGGRRALDEDAESLDVNSDGGRGAEAAGGRGDCGWRAGWGLHDGWPPAQKTAQDGT